jgi:hypothetical protein
MRVETSRTKNAVQNSISGLISASFDESEGPQKKKKTYGVQTKSSNRQVEEEYRNESST